MTGSEFADATDGRMYDAILVHDVIVIGTGVAGLTVALGVATGQDAPSEGSGVNGRDASYAKNSDSNGHAEAPTLAASGLTTSAPHLPSTNGRARRVAVITKSTLGTGGSSVWAQGGVAAALRADDSPALHAADTLAVGGGLGQPEIVALLTTEGPRQVRRLIEEWGAQFDHTPTGELEFGREAAHSRARILHAHGDATGAEMVRALAASVLRHPTIEVFESTMASDLVMDMASPDMTPKDVVSTDLTPLSTTADPTSHADAGASAVDALQGLTRSQGRVMGVLARGADGRRVFHLAHAVVVATGGIGHIYAHTTNPPENTGDGLAMAARAGARLADLEFVQFHPTALAVGADPMPLVTEALRGEGAWLVDETGHRFMLEEHPLAELAPRDVVARAIWKRLHADPKTADAPAPRVFLDARQAVGDRFPDRFPTVFALCQRHGVDPRRDLIPVSPACHYHMGGIEVDASGRASLSGLWACGEVAATGAHGANRLASNSLLEALVFGARVAEDILGAWLPDPGAGAPVLPGSEDLRIGNGNTAHVAWPASEDRSRTAEACLEAARKIMWRWVGVMREDAGLVRALFDLDALAAALPPGPSEARNVLTAGRIIAAAALARRESRGAHFRTDYPDLDARFARHLVAVLPRDPHAAVQVGFEREPLPASAHWFAGVPHNAVDGWLESWDAAVAASPDGAQGVASVPSVIRSPLQVPHS